jgi:DOPA 4,5-dioxygenase
MVFEGEPMTVLTVDQIVSYHAHIYFKDAAQRDTAALLRDQIAARFRVQLGRWREETVGPHERPMYQVAFATDLFAEFVPWLMLNRDNLAVLVHPNTGAPRRDHLVHALWLGEMLPIVRPEQLPDTADTAGDAVIPNTNPTLQP